MKRTAALWAFAAVATVGLAYVRYHQASRAPAGADFTYFLHAARDVAAGRSPYSVKQYVYPPTLALLLAPFSHFGLANLWRGWTLIGVVAPLIAVAAFVRSPASRIAPRLRPPAFLLCAFTILCPGYFPLSRDLALGQFDTVVFPILTLSALSATSRRRAQGFFIGLSGLLKVWPAAAGLCLLQRGSAGRRPALAVLIGTLLLGPVMALAFGWSGLVGLVSNGFDARQQHLVSDSVWDVPALLFSNTGLARPLYVSFALQLAVSALLAGWVLALLAVTLRTRGNGSLVAWNVAFCVILLLPVSHRQYAMYVLPLLWWWASRRRFAVAAVLLGWWLCQLVAWPYNGSPATISSIRYSIPFLADLVACTTSIWANRLLGGVRQGFRQGGVGQTALDDVADFEVGRHR